MALTHTQTQITWSSASTKSVTSATEVESDVMTLDATCVALSIQLSTDTTGTPSAGDTAVFRVKWSTGDVLADSGDDYDTSEYATWIATLDTLSTNTPGEDPARTTVPVPSLATKFKLTVVCANAATHTMTIAARMDEQRFA